MAEVKLEISEEAARTLGDMRRRVADIEMEYGRFSEEHLTALKSLLDNVLGVLRLGGRISREGELSLFGASFIAYGVIWHAKYINGTERDPLLGDWSTHS
jgi:hypothetical protein